MINFDQFKLAITDEVINIDNRDDTREAATVMVKQCSRTLDIISRLLDPPIYDSTDFIEAVRQFLVTRRKPKIRVIVFDPATIVRNGHRLIELSGALSSFVEIRKAHHEHNDYNESLLVADKVGYIHRKNAERYDGTVNFNDKRQSRYLMKGFEEMWDTATSDPNLRRMTI